MTGFGKASCECDGEVVTVELSTVNHRFFDCTIRLPGPWSALEAPLKAALKKPLSRGKVNVFVSRRGSRGAVSAVRFDEELARQYVAAARELGKLMGTGEAMSLDVLAQLDGVFYLEEAEEDLEKTSDMLLDLAEKAVGQLDEMRLSEGAAMARDIRDRLEVVRRSVDVV